MLKLLPVPNTPIFSFPPTVIAPNAVVESEVKIPTLFCPPVTDIAPLTVFVPPLIAALIE